MAVNHVNLSSGEELIDLRHDTVTKDVLLKGYTAHGADGEPIVGEYEPESDVVDSGQCGENAIWTFYNDGRFVVSGSGKAEKSDEYDNIKNGVTTVFFEDGITEIGNSFCRNFENLVNVFVADTVDIIYSWAFAHCSALESISLPNNMTEMHSYVFANCTALRSITIPFGITSLEESAFAYCFALQNVFLPKSIKQIEISFNDCTSLESVTIPEGVTELMGVFTGCTGLKSVIIPKSVTLIDEWTFLDVDSLEAIYYTGTKEEWDSIDISEYNNAWLNATLYCEYDPNADTVDGWNVQVLSDGSDPENITKPTITFIYTVGG